MGVQSISNSGLGRRNAKRSLEGVTGLPWVPPGLAGRSLMLGGYTTTFVNTIDYIQIETLGNATDFGDTTLARSAGGPCSSSTRALLGGGVAASGTAGNNTIDYVTIASTGNATDFGDLTVARSSLGALSNSTRGVFGGGLSGVAPSVNTAVIDYVTIATTGNASNFGNLTVSRTDVNDSGCGSSTRGLFAGGFNHQTPANYYRSEIDYVTIATTGNATSFGSLAAGTYNVMGASSGTRALFAGGGTQASGLILTTRYVTVATTGNTTAFGDLLVTRRGGGTSSQIRAVFGCGESSSAYVTNIEYFTFETLGNATNFGNSTQARATTATSSSHGGLQ